MNRSLGAVVVVALLAITGCTTGQPSAGGSASPSVAAPSTTSIPSSIPTSTSSPEARPAVASIHEGPLAAGTYRVAQGDTACSERQPRLHPIART
jgi:hypothetical protein